jgi:type II secretory pathway component GspD/PulD (secretin)
MMKTKEIVEKKTGLRMKFKIASKIIMGVGGKTLGIAQIFLLLCFGVMIWINSTVVPCWGVDVGSKSPVFSLDSKDEPLSKVIEKISRATGYEITISEEWEDELITAKLDNVPLMRALREIIRKTGIKSYALIEENGMLQVFIFDGKFPSQLQHGTRIEMDRDEIVIGPAASHPGVTRWELQALQERQIRELERAKDPDEIVISPAGRQLQVLQKEVKSYGRG